VKRASLICSLCFIALIVLASTVWTKALWGLSSWAAVPPLLAFFCAILVTPQLFLTSTPNPLRRIPPVRSAFMRLLIVAVLSIAVLWLLRSRHTLWGERATLGAAIGDGDYRPGAPLSTLLQWVVFRFMNGVFLWNAGSVMTLFGILAGLLYAMLAIRTADLCSAESHEMNERRLGAAFLLANGFVVVFFGSGGNVSIATALVLAFIAAGLQSIRDARSPFLPAILLAAAILSHLSAAYLVPAFIYAAALAPGTGAGKRRALTAVGMVLLGWLVVEIVVPRVTGSPGPARLAYATLVQSNAAFGRGGVKGVARTLSLSLNALLIMGPSSVVAVLLLVSPRRRSHDQHADIRRHEERFLFLCALSALIMCIVGSPRLDGGLRWTEFAATGPAFAAFALWTLKNRYAGRERCARTVWACVLLGMVQLLPLVIVDAVPRFAEKRILALPLTPGRGEMMIADAALERGKLNDARTWYLASIGKNPSDAVAQARLGGIAMKQEEYAAAISQFLKAHELKPADPAYRYELAEALIANRWFPEAIAQLETLTVTYADSVSFWRRLGFARNNGNRYEPAIAAYERALALEPSNEENVRNLVSAILNRAAELQGEKNYPAAISNYNRAISLYPKDWRAYNNLAVIEMDAGSVQKAYDILTEALKLHPFESSLHFNMGIVLEKRGDLKAALEHMQMAQELEPMYSKAPMHIERLAKKLGIWKPAQPDSQRSPLKMP
jgi:tetratricopeptide (TPR) repeat protein